MSNLDVADLLSPAEPALAVKYLQRLVRQTGSPPVEVRLDSGGGKGKGVFATLDIEEGQEIFREAPLVGEQHTANRSHALVCEQCFCYVGSLELQIGHQIARLRPEQQAMSEGLLTRASHAPLQALAGGSDSGLRDLPRAVRCPGECGHLFCSQACAARAWAGWHCLLCTGTCDTVEERVAMSPDTMPFDAAACSAEVREATGLDAVEPPPASGAPAGSRTVQGFPPWIPGAVDARSLAAFYQHADSTNDIFRVAARLTAQMVCKVHWLTREERGPKGARTPVGPAALDAALLEAWLPVRMGHKAVWWECVPMPEDLDDEASWRAQLRELANDSLTLLQNALGELGAGTLPALFSDRVWGSLIGMFELNNLSLAVESPVEAFFLAIDDLEEPQRAASMRTSQPLLDVLDTDYDVACQGTAFYCLQSCLNHAHQPSVHAFKGDDDMDGCAVLTAKRRIARGEELFISYVDEDEPLEARMAVLRDYGIYQ